MQNYTKQNNTKQICCGPTLGTEQERIKPLSQWWSQVEG